MFLEKLDVLQAVHKDHILEFLGHFDAVVHQRGQLVNGLPVLNFFERIIWLAKDQELKDSLEEIQFVLSYVVVWDVEQVKDSTQFVSRLNVNICLQYFFQCLLGGYSILCESTPLDLLY